MDTSRNYIVKISKYFGVSVDWLLGVDEMSNGDTQADLKEIANLYAAASEDDLFCIYLIGN